MSRGKEPKWRRGLSGRKPREMKSGKPREERATGRGQGQQDQMLPRGQERCIENGPIECIHEEVTLSLGKAVPMR